MTVIAHGAVTVSPGEAILSRWWRTVDKVVLGCLLALFAIGILLGLAASVPLAESRGLPKFHFVERQVMFGAIALPVMLIVSMMSPTLVRRLSVIGFAGALVAVMLLPLFGTDHGKGAVRWFSLGPANLQPSEFLKPTFAVVTAWMIAASMQPHGPPGRTISAAMTVVIVGFLVMQPDFGQAMLHVIAWSAIYFVAGAPMALITAVIALVAVGGVVAYASSAHFAGRIDGFLDPEVDPRTQLGYATNAIREGGFLGAGVNEGQVKWTLPDAHTDFIIAVAAEEYGLIMVLAIVALFATVTMRCLIRLTRERDMFNRLAGTGLTVLIASQAFVNLGVAVRLLPAKGMTLPFVSYGGSSLVAMGGLAGMLLCFTRARAQNDIRDHFGAMGGDAGAIR